LVFYRMFGTEAVVSSARSDGPGGDSVEGVEQVCSFRVE